jgi:DNA-directed RNA polymerase I and III subunit RPAC1
MRNSVQSVGFYVNEKGSLGYRLLPEIRIVKPITGPDALKFQKCFVKGVVGISKDRDGTDIAVVEQPRLDTVSRECLRHPEFEGKVLLSRKRDHFIYNTESVGSLPPQVCFLACSNE